MAAIAAAAAHHAIQTALKPAQTAASAKIAPVIIDGGNAASIDPKVRTHAATDTRVDTPPRFAKSRSNSKNGVPTLRTIRRISATKASGPAMENIATIAMRRMT